MGISADDITVKAFDSARRHQLESGNCPQCTLAGIFEALGIEDETVFRASTGLAGGVGLVGDGHCGALSGGTLALSYLYGRKKEDFLKVRKVLRACLLAKHLHELFMARYGTCRCADIQAKLAGRFYNMYDEKENAAAAKAGLPAQCGELVGDVARMTVQIILEERAREA